MSERDLNDWWRNKGSHLLFRFDQALSPVRARMDMKQTYRARQLPFGFSIVPCMRVAFSIALRRFLTRLPVWAMTALSLACIGAQPGRAAGETATPTAIQFTLDRPLDASDAPFVLASTRGLFRSENLGVATNIATGPADAIARVASGSSDLALVDRDHIDRNGEYAKGGNFLLGDNHVLPDFGDGAWRLGG